MGRRFPATRLLAVGVLLAAAFFLTSCEVFDSPQNTFSPRGDVAESQKDDFLLVMWPALAIMIGVLGACVVLPVMFRRKKGDPGLPKQIHGNTALELTWTIIPALLLLVIGVFVVDGIVELGRKPKDDALRVKVTGQQFSWTFEYPDYEIEPGVPLDTLDEVESFQNNPVGVLFIPVDREIGLTITSSDVNHSFWVPRLAGKLDAINNHTNTMWMKADEPGEFVGQCAEFCGFSHAFMRLKVVALPQEEFDAWVQSKGAIYRPQTDDDAPELASQGD